nr:MAG TPA: hypothetical protein [Caudoviricetes sp.]
MDVNNYSYLVLIFLYKRWGTPKNVKIWATKVLGHS